MGFGVANNFVISQEWWPKETFSTGVKLELQAELVNNVSESASSQLSVLIKAFEWDGVTEYWRTTVKGKVIVLEQFVSQMFYIDYVLPAEVNRGMLSIKWSASHFSESMFPVNPVVLWSSSPRPPTPPSDDELMLVQLAKVTTEIASTPIIHELGSAMVGLSDEAASIFLESWSKALFGVDRYGKPMQPDALDMLSCGIDLLSLGVFPVGGITDDVLKGAFKTSAPAREGLPLVVKRLAGYADDAVGWVVHEDDIIEVAQTWDMTVEQVRAIMKLPVEMKDDAVKLAWGRTHGLAADAVQRVFAGQGIDVSKATIEGAMGAKTYTATLMQVFKDSLKVGIEAKDVNKIKFVVKWGLRLAAAGITLISTAIFTSFIFEEALQTVSMAAWIAIQNKDWGGLANLIGIQKDIIAQLRGWLSVWGWAAPPLVAPYTAFANASEAQVNTYENALEDQSPPDHSTTVRDGMVGKVREVTDGDTFDIFIQQPDPVVFTIRVVGINAPERGEPFFADSKNWLFAKIYGQDVTIHTDPNNLQDSYGRVLATVILNGEDIGLQMVKEGWAFYYPYKPHVYVNDGEYTAAETGARQAHLGIWAGAVGKIKAYSNPTHAEYIIDGISRGLTPNQSDDIPIGTYTVILRYPGYDDYQIPTQVTVTTGQVTEIAGTWALTQTGVPPGPPGLPPIIIPGPTFKINIESEPANAWLYVDGVYTGHWTPSNETELKDVLDLFTPGPHEIKVRKAGFEAMITQNIIAGDNGTIKLTIQQTTPPGTPPDVPTSGGYLEIYSTPSYAEIWIDGAYTHHKTPAPAGELGLLNPGSLELELKRSGYYLKQTVTIEAGKTTKINTTIPSVIPGQEPGNPEAVGFIEIYTTPANAQIWIDGVYTHHMTPAPKGELSPLTPGSYLVNLTKGGYSPYSATVSVSQGATSQIGTTSTPVVLSPVSGTSPPVTPPTTELEESLRVLLNKLSTAEISVLYQSLISGLLIQKLG